MSGRRIDPEEVRRIARLARLALTEAEIERLSREMGAILAHLEALGAAEPDPGPTSSAPAVSPTRPDVPGSDPLQAPPERWAPAWAAGFFVVPRLPVMEPEEAGGRGEVLGADP